MILHQRYLYALTFIRVAYANVRIDIQLQFYPDFFLALVSVSYTFYFNGILIKGSAILMLKAI